MQATTAVSGLPAPLPKSLSKPPFKTWSNCRSPSVEAGPRGLESHSQLGRVAAAELLLPRPPSLPWGLAISWSRRASWVSATAAGGHQPGGGTGHRFDKPHLLEVGTKARQSSHRQEEWLRHQRGQVLIGIGAPRAGRGKGTPKPNSPQPSCGAHGPSPLVLRTSLEPCPLSSSRSRTLGSGGGTHLPSSGSS